MTRQHKNEMIVGAVTLMVLGLTLFIVLTLGDFDSLTQRQKTITIQVPYRSGLQGIDVGSPIVLGGAKVGKVTRAGVESFETGPDGQSVTVSFDMRISDDLQLYEDCELAVGGNLLGGFVSLTIRDLGGKGTLLEDRAVIKKDLGGGLGDLLDTFQERLMVELDRENEESLLALLVRTAENLDALSAKLDRQLAIEGEEGTFAQKLHDLLNRFNTVAETVEQQLSDDNDQAALARLNRALDLLGESLERVDAILAENQDDVRQAISGLRRTIDAVEQDVPAVLSSMKDMLADADEGAVAFRDAMGSLEERVLLNRSRIDGTLENLQQISSTLNLAAVEIRRAPWRLLYKPDHDEETLQNLVDAAGAFAVSAERLETASGRLESALSAVEKEVPVDPAVLQEILSELQLTFERFQEAEIVFWDELQ